MPMDPYTIEPADIVDARTALDVLDAFRRAGWTVAVSGDERWGVSISQGWEVLHPHGAGAGDEFLAAVRQAVRMAQAAATMRP